LRELEKHLALYFTGFARTASEIAQEQLRVTPQGTRELNKKLLCIAFGFSTRGSHVVVYQPEDVYDQTLANERNAIYGQGGRGKHVSEVST
jgi:hypothetical protein